MLVDMVDRPVTEDRGEVGDLDDLAVEVVDHFLSGSEGRSDGIAVSRGTLAGGSHLDS